MWELSFLSYTVHDKTMKFIRNKISQFDSLERERERERESQICPARLYCII